PAHRTRPRSVCPEHSQEEKFSPWLIICSTNYSTLNAAPLPGKHSQNHLHPLLAHRRALAILPVRVSTALTAPLPFFQPKAMPTYEHVCATSEETFEIFQSIKDDALTECPKPDCEGKIKRMISAGAGIIFKGSGFYQTDYRSASYAAGAKADKPASSTAGS